MRRTLSLLIFGSCFLTLATLVGCSRPQAAQPSARVQSSFPQPVAMMPTGGSPNDARPATQSHRALDLSQPGAAAWSTTEPEIIDTSTFPTQRQIDGPWSGPTRRTREIVPPHEYDHSIPHGLRNALPVGLSSAGPRTSVDRLFPGLGQTPWVPPDPTLAVGPNHIVATVNMALAFYWKDGTLIFSVPLNDAGSPGFFETVGSRGFTFDPKCFYDAIDQRFVVLALEVYADTEEAYITFAVSDDDNPEGVWFKYRTDAVIDVAGATFWWDYPGFGYDADAYYVNGNLFGLNQNAFGGVGFRVFDKTPLLSGQTAQFATLRDENAASAQAAQHFGANQAAYFVSLATDSAIRLHAITNPTTNPTLVSTTVNIPQFTLPNGALTTGDPINTIDARIMNAQWRDGDLYACHNISSGTRDLARWYHLQTNNWPASGSPSFVQSGNIDAGPDMHTFFPAIYSNRFGDVGMVFGTSSPTTPITVAVTGRTVSDPPGVMGAPTDLKVATEISGGRWGDYYDIAIDPVDDARFWIVGEYPESFGWSTWISSFTVTSGSTPVAVPDDGGLLFALESRTVDVLANDFHPGGLAFDIDSFDATSINGAAIKLSVGSGPGGRDELTYQAPPSFFGPDSFDYTISDVNNNTASASVSFTIGNPDDFRDPENPVGTLPGLSVAYYEAVNIPVLPDFSALTPYLTEIVPEVNFAPTGGNFAGSGRTDDVAAVFTGFVSVPVTDTYTFFTESDDGSALFIGNTLVVNNDGTHGMQQHRGEINLKAGVHALRVEYFERNGQAGLFARIEGGGMLRQVIPAGLLVHTRCLGDLDDDGAVGLTDLSLLLANFGTTSGAETSDGDLTGDGDVDLEDLSIMLGRFGAMCS